MKNRLLSLITKLAIIIACWAVLPNTAISQDKGAKTVKTGKSKSRSKKIKQGKRSRKKSYKNQDKATRKRMKRAAKNAKRRQRGKPMKNNRLT